MNPNITWLVFEISCGMLTLPIGFGLFIYLLWLGQLNASFWVFLSTLLVCATLHLNVLLFRQKLDDWYDPYALENIKFFSILNMSASTIALGIYISLGLVHHEKMEIESHFGSAIAATFTLFFSSYLLGMAKRYKRYVELTMPPLVNRTGRRY